MTVDYNKKKSLKHLQQLREGRAEEDEFDKWYDTLPPEKQKELRALDPPIIPYREMPQLRYSFPIYDTCSSKYASEDVRRLEEQDAGDEDTFISRERVIEIINDLISMMGASSDLAVVYHFELIKIIMKSSDAPSQSQLAARMGLTRQAISARAKRMMVLASESSINLLSRINYIDADDKLINYNLDNKLYSAPAGVNKKTITHPPSLRESSTTAKKRRNFKADGQEGYQLPDATPNPSSSLSANARHKRKGAGK